MPSPTLHSDSPQSRYQVRLHLGADPEAMPVLTEAADLVVFADALPDPSSPSGPGSAVSVIGFGFRRSAARAVLEAQADAGERVFVAVVTPLSAGGGFAVEDFLLAGAVVDALAEVGIDYSSPEAAAACAAFVSLRGAVGHLVSASEEGQRWVAAGRGAELAALCRLDTDQA
ncbi:hypothetical protein N1031_12125 [Herbiconiux moechotypicola]|nr:hypothetical protein [Herbiconiux moechotypicola]MCS5730510.1 hypothetical protein [Herbiconiux moechotypicola]